MKLEIEPGSIHAIVIIRQFMEKVLLSKKRRTIFYKKDELHPKRLDGSIYGTDSEGYIIDLRSGTRVIKNVRTAGKEKWVKISGQDLWSGINHNLRSKIAKELKKFFYFNLRDVQPISPSSYPLGIGIEIYDVYDDGDIDNMEHIYRKCLHDAMCGNVSFIKNEAGKWVPERDKYPPIIEDDNKRCVQEIWTRFFPIENHEERMMKIIIYSL